MINKKQKKKVLLISIAILSAIILIGVLSQNFNLPLSVALDSNLGQCSGGFTSFSIDHVTINSDKSRIRVYGVAKGSECMNIRLTTSQLDSFLKNDGMDATKDVTGEIRLLEYTKTFPIDTIGTYNNLYDNKIISGTGFDSPSVSLCKSKGYSNTIYAYKPFSLYNVRCVLSGENGVAGDFSGSRSYGNFDIRFTLDGRSTTLSREQQSVNIGNHHIEWTGNLVNLDEIYPPQYDARLIGSKWELVNDGTLSSVNSKLDDFVNCMNIRGTPAYKEDSDYDYCKSQFDSQVNSLLQNKLEQYKSYNSNLIYDADTDSNALYVSLKATPFPTFILDLDAEDVGIIALEGKPQITSCITNQNLKSGENKVVLFSVKNNANSDNVEFYGSINCNQGVTAYISNFNIGAMQTKTITSELIPSNPNQGDLSFSCNVKIQDVKSGNSDTCSFSGKVEYVSGITCQPNSLSCDNNLKNLLKCTSDGKDKELYKECTYGCEYASGSAKCREEEQEDLISCSDCDAFIKNKLLGWIFPSQKCEKTFFQNNLTCIFSWIRYAIIIPILIFTILFGYNFFESNKRFKIKSKGVRLLVSSLIGLVISVVTFFLFWAGVIFFVVYIAGSILLNFFIIKK